MGLTRLLLRLLLGRRLPVTAGELRVRGPSAPITIRRDDHSIPHIDAESATDAAFALGFCQGQDRAGQLEVLWRIGRGRLAEWVGPAGLGADRMSRRIGFRRTAEAQLPVQSEAIRGILTSFAAGVSAGNTVGLSAKPHEFAILGGEPSAWDAADVLAGLKLQSVALPSNWDVELARLRILLADGASAMLALDPLSIQKEGEKGRHGEWERRGDHQLRDTSPTLPPSLSPPLFDHLLADLNNLQAFLPPGGGSNNWVIAGSRTASGQPILASDPHLAPSAPPPWYLAHARCPEWEAAGAAMAGAPGFPIGHNGFAAWGVTAGLTDNSDLFLETIGPDRRSVREADGTFSTCDVVRETIPVKGQPDVVEEVVITPRGPLISPLIPDVPYAVSLRAVWLDPLPLNGFLGAMQAKSFDEFRLCFGQWPSLPLNILYADTTGATGYQLAGQLPRRAGGHGLLPRPADAPDSGWLGLVSFEEMLNGADFEAGYFATANDDVLSQAATVKSPVSTGGLTAAARQAVGWDFCDPYRVQAIRESLAARDGWTVADCLALQQDTRSIPWEEVRDIVLSLAPADPAAREGLELLRGWDGRVDSESPAASIFELFVAEMCARVAKAKAPKAWQVVLGESGLGTFEHSLFADRRVAHLVNLIREQPAGWFVSWPAEMCDALAGVVRTLRRDVGPGPAYWAWGHLRQLLLTHQLFGKHRWLGAAFNLGPVPCSGDCNTISQAGARPAKPTAYTHNMCNLRTVFDLADLSKSQFVLCGGQSGNPWSDHYADQLSLWQAGESVPIPWLQAEVIRAARNTLRLLPS